MILKTHLTVLFFLIPIYGFSQNLYQVKKGETLSEILQRQYPTKRLYGKHGNVLQVLAMNPELINPNKIIPGQILILNKPTNEEGFFQENSSREELKRNIGSDVDSLKPQTQEAVLNESWANTLTVGTKFLSVSQRGLLNKANVGELVFNHLRFNSIFKIQEWSGELYAETFRFQSKFINPSSTQLHAFKLEVVYSWLTGGIHFDQTPLFNNSTSGIELIKQTTIYLLIGAKKEFNLSNDSVLKLSGLLHFPQVSTTNNHNFSIESIKGNRMSAIAVLKKRIFEERSYSAYLTWINDLSYQHLKQDIESASKRGQVTSTIIGFSSGFGIDLNF
jgi:hypothetical protein